MRQWIAEGRVNAESMVWREGWDDWKQAGSLFPAFQSNPGGSMTTVPALNSAVSDAGDNVLGGQGKLAISPGENHRSGSSHGHRRPKTNKGPAVAIVVILVLAVVGLLPVLLYVASR